MNDKLEAYPTMNDKLEAYPTMNDKLEAYPTDIGQAGSLSHVVCKKGLDGTASVDWGHIHYFLGWFSGPENWLFTDHKHEVTFILRNARSHARKDFFTIRRL
jgi:hypothetical protein